MKKLLFSLLALAPISLFAQSNNWKLDNSHASVKFAVTHLAISEVEGKFKTFEGDFVSAKPDFSDAQISFSVDVNSVDTDSEGRDKHLKGDDFFATDKYPKMTFKSTSFKKVNGKEYALEGNLTIRDVTKKVKFKVIGGSSIKDPWGNNRAGFKATTTIDRTQFNVSGGRPAVGADVEIVLNLEFVQAKA